MIYITAAGVVVMFLSISAQLVKITRLLTVLAVKADYIEGRKAAGIED